MAYPPEGGRNAGDLFIDSSSVKRNGDSIFYNQLVNYRIKQSNGALSFVTNSEVNCRSLLIRDLNYQLYKKKMAKGKNFYNGNPSKKWKTYKYVRNSPASNNNLLFKGSIKIN